MQLIEKKQIKEFHAELWLNKNQLVHIVRGDNI